ncbi:MAG: AmmeMemoRadiSam system protein A [Thermoleophilia bacterium]
MTPKTNPAVYAREVVKAMLENQPVPQPPDEDFFRQRSACFVSIKKDGQLRGCIGTLAPVETDLGHEIQHNARSAAFGDPRFNSIAPDELSHLKISVDVLSAPVDVSDTGELDCARHGVIVSCDYRRGVLLPDLEGVDSVEQQLAIACQKAGIGAHEQFQIQSFTVDRYREDD